MGTLAARHQHTTLRSGIRKFVRSEVAGQSSVGTWILREPEEVPGGKSVPERKPVILWSCAECAPRALGLGSWGCLGLLGRRHPFSSVKPPVEPSERLFVTGRSQPFQLPRLPLEPRVMGVGCFLPRASGSSCLWPEWESLPTLHVASSSSIHGGKRGSVVESSIIIFSFLFSCQSLCTFEKRRHFKRVGRPQKRPKLSTTRASLTHNSPQLPFSRNILGTPKARPLFNSWSVCPMPMVGRLP